MLGAFTIYMYMKINNNRMIKCMLDNYFIPPKNDCLMHVDPKLYIKCLPQTLLE